MTLFDAVLAQDADALEKLAAKVRDINEQFEGGRTALIEAAARGHLECVKRLLIAGADPDLTDADQETALLKAALNGHYPVVHLLSPLATDDQRDLARSLMSVHRVPFDPDRYQGRDEEVSEWKRAAAAATARLASLLGDDRATRRLERVERSELNANLKRKLGD